MTKPLRICARFQITRDYLEAADVRYADEKNVVRIELILKRGEKSVYQDYTLAQFARMLKKTRLVEPKKFGRIPCRISK